MKEGLDLIKVRKELKGNTLKLYLYLTKRSSGYTIDEMKFFSGFSNKALINQCLAEMKRLGIVEKREDRYYVPRPIAEAVDYVLKHYVKVGNKILPRGFISAIAYLAFLLVFFAVFPSTLLLLPFGLAMSSIFILIGIYEAYRLRKLVKKVKEPK